MKTAVAKKEIESALADRFGTAFRRREKQPTEILPTGIPEIDRLFNGFPRGAITEIHGAASSGRTSVLLSTLAIATAQEETCAVVDCSDTFDPLSAANARVALDRLLWVRCGKNIERAFKATDLLLQSGGFGLVVLNLSDIAGNSARRIISSWWFRFRHAIENTPTALVVITPIACLRSCAGLVLKVSNECVVWPNTLSLVFENNDASLTIKPGREHPTHHLSLVTKSTRALSSHSVSLTHSQILKGSRVQVDRERSLEPNNRRVRFQIRFN